MRNRIFAVLLIAIPALIRTGGWLDRVYRYDELHDELAIADCEVECIDGPVGLVGNLDQPGEDDPGGIGHLLATPAQEVQPVQARHEDIGEDDVDVRLLAEGEGVCSASHAVAHFSPMPQAGKL